MASERSLQDDVDEIYKNSNQMQTKMDMSNRRSFATNFLWIGVDFARLLRFLLFILIVTEGKANSGAKFMSTFLMLFCVIGVVLLIRSFLSNEKIINGSSENPQVNYGIAAYFAISEIIFGVLPYLLISMFL